MFGGFFWVVHVSVTVHQYMDNRILVTHLPVLILILILYRFTQGRNLSYTIFSISILQTGNLINNITIQYWLYETSFFHILDPIFKLLFNSVYALWNPCKLSIVTCIISGTKYRDTYCILNMYYKCALYIILIYTAVTVYHPQRKHN